MSQILGWDIGGAHLKLARMHREGSLIDVRQIACPLWQGLPALSAAMDHLLTPADRQSSTSHVLTMTGELVDAFEDRLEGVRILLDFMKSKLDGASIQVFAGDLGFLRLEAVTEGMRVHIASANWLSSGLWVGKVRSHALLIDIGSTTTDLLPVIEGKPQYLGYSDEERMDAGELVYTGVVRTPLMALSAHVPFKGRWKSVLAESFATASDIYRLSAQIREVDDHYPAADHGEKTPSGSARRIARQYGLDRSMIGDNAILRMAHYLREQQLKQILEALHQVLSSHDIEASSPLVAAGVGRFLVPELARRLHRPWLEFDELFACPANSGGFTAADCAPAAAIAALMASR